MGCFGVWPWRQYVHVIVSHEIKVWGSLKIGYTFILHFYLSLFCCAPNNSFWPSAYTLVVGPEWVVWRPVFGINIHIQYNVRCNGRGNFSAFDYKLVE